MNPAMFYDYLPAEEQKKWDEAKTLLEKIQKNQLPACLAHLIFENVEDVRFSTNFSFCEIVIFSERFSGVKRKHVRHEFAKQSIKISAISLLRWLLMIWCSKKVQHMIGVWKMRPRWKKFRFSKRTPRNLNFTIYRQLPQCFLRTLPSSVWDCSTKDLTAKMKAGKISAQNFNTIILK